MPAKIVFLDWGGTLVAPSDAYPVFRGVLASHGIDVRPEPFAAALRRMPVEDASSARAFLGRTDDYWRRWDRRVLRELGIPDAEGVLGDALRVAFLDPRWHAPFPESHDVLVELGRRGYRLHVVSNHTEDLRRIVANLGWSDLFESLTVSQEVGAEKPDPRIFRLALARAGAEPQEVHHVGDSWEKDVEGARRLGIHPIWVNRSADPDRPGVPSVRDLRAVFRALEGRT